MDNASNAFNYSVGGIAVGSTVISVGVWVKSSLPDTRMKELDGVLLDTRQEYQKSDAEGLLPSDFKFTVEAKLAALERSRDQLKERAYRAISLLDQVVAFIQGLSSQIMLLADRVKVLRANVVTKSEESRRLRDGRNTTSLDHDAHHLRSASLADDDSTAGGSTREVDQSVPPCGADRQVPPQLTNQPMIFQSHCQSTAPDGRVTAAPQPRQLNHSIWSRMWSWRTSSHQPPKDLESGAGGAGTST
ncbi:hypothetical protein Hypma_001982 [Hypsizygus marmoreus]|uniref:Uncharacterized protein n=1 Tax=Hypsizygus marmoreus TaxID=39966 RepID=A0A369JCJ9_HYPMA|nr:hypothetical protein Hypma_001982 [Hypsizygus marmoreus]